jgi:hypothetical protein
MELSGAENFFESHGGQPRRQKWRLKPIAFVQVVEKFQIRCLADNPLFTRVSGVFCTTKQDGVLVGWAVPITKLGFPIKEELGKP